MAEKVDTSLDAVDDMVAFMHRRAEGTWAHADAIHVAALLYALQAKLEEARTERDVARRERDENAELAKRRTAQLMDAREERDLYGNQWLEASGELHQLRREARALPPGKTQSALVALNWLEVHSTTDMPGAKAAWDTIRAALPTQETE